jgi:sulfite dehydrogenase (quinone) subunit SoeA
VSPRDTLDTSPKVSDEIRKTTCYMCACRCGIDVHIRDGQVSHIEGNRDHPVNRGVLCAKGAAGVMNHLSPARLRAPLRRTGPRGSGEFREITWDEALNLAVNWLAPLRAKHPEKLAFFTGRDQSQSFTGWWAQQFGTPNYAAHGGFCSVNMAAAGIYTLGGSVLGIRRPGLGSHEVPDDLRRGRGSRFSNPMKIGLGKLKARGARVVSVNPVRTGYNAVADEWLGHHAGYRRALHPLARACADGGGQDRPALSRALHRRPLAGGPGPGRSTDYGTVHARRGRAELALGPSATPGGPIRRRGRGSHRSAARS